jgi:uncharacterized membrane protein
LELYKVSIPLCKLIPISWVHHAMEMDVQMMHEGSWIIMVVLIEYLSMYVFVLLMLKKDWWR